MRTTTRIGGKVSAAASQYGTLLADIRPEVAHADEKYRALLKQLSSLLVRDKLREAEEKLVELLRVLIQEYERERFKNIEKAPAIEVIKHLMEHQGLKQKDLVPVVFETESVASEVLKGIRGLTLKHVKRLSERFQLAPDVFMDDVDD